MSNDLEYVQISMMSRERGNFIPAKANFAAGCGQSGEKFNAGWNKICRSQAIDRILNILLACWSPLIEF